MIRQTTLAPAKINLSLRVLGKRADGFHDLASIVAFADAADQLSLQPGEQLSLEVDGPMAAPAGPKDSNLVLRAARILSERIPRLQTGRFVLTKNLPVGAGLGGGSSDAAAALRLLAEANDVPVRDPRVADAAALTGSDVPVCLEPSARLMHGRGEIVSGGIDLPPLHAVLVFPGTGLETARVFGALDLNRITLRERPYESEEIPRSLDALVEFLAGEPNDLEAVARKLVPQIGEAIELLQQTNVVLARMSGSGSAVFGIYESTGTAEAAARSLKQLKPDWWVVTTALR